MVVDDSFGEAKAPRLQAEEVEGVTGGLHQVKLSPLESPFTTEEEAGRVCALYAASSDRPETPLHYAAIQIDFVRQFAGQVSGADFRWYYSVVPEGTGFVILVTFGDSQAMELAGFPCGQIPMESSD